MVTHGVMAKWEVMKLIFRCVEWGWSVLVPAAVARGEFILAKAGFGGNCVIRTLMRLGSFKEVI